MICIFHFRYGIELIGISSDGDNRLLSSMRYKTQIGAQIRNYSISPYFKCVSQRTYFVQDPTHIGTKARNRLLKPSIILPFGKKQISLGHLKILLNKVSKEVHGLVMSDICPQDRQNFNSLEKLMDDRVIKALILHIPDSEATVLFLKLCKEVTSCFMDPSLSHLERIQRACHSVFVLRIWRKWIQNTAVGSKKKIGSESKDSCGQSYNLKDNFITNNAYCCIEINTHQLIQLITKFRDCGTPELFIPILFSSQMCEQAFRQIRSMGTINFTKINYSLLEVMHVMNRIELQNDIVYFKLAELDIKFPRVFRKFDKCFSGPLPSNDEITNEIEKAREDAINDCLAFGMEIDEQYNFLCELPVIDHANLQNILPYNADDEDNSDCDEEDTAQAEKMLIPSTNLSGNIPENNSENDRLKHYLEVTDKEGNSKLVRKTSYLWSLTDSKLNLSKDRLRRVQEAEMKKPRRHLDFCKDTVLDPDLPLYKADYLCIGEWTIFRVNTDISQLNRPILKNLVIGLVLGFRYIKNSSASGLWKSNHYTWDCCAVKPPNDAKNARGIEVLGTWYVIEKTGKLCDIKEKSNFYVNIENYVINVNKSVVSFDNKQLLLNNNISQMLQNRGLMTN